MGVLPLQFLEKSSHKTLNLNGDEIFDIIGIEDDFKPQMNVELRINRSNGKMEKVNLLSRIDTDGEAEYYLHGGILHFVLRQLAA